MRDVPADRTDEELRTYGEIAAAVAYGSGRARRPSSRNFTVRLLPPRRHRRRSSWPRPPPSRAPSPGHPRPDPDRPPRRSSTAVHLESADPDDADLRWRAVAGINADRRRRLRRRRPAPADGGDPRAASSRYALPHRRRRPRRRTRASAGTRVRRAFRPLTRIEDTAAAIAAGDLTQRVPEPSTRDEVASLSRSLNAMLAQIEQSFAVREASEERMRQFVADASHELRTPLAAVRGYAELYRQGAVTQRPRTSPAPCGRIESEASRMGGLVEDLLVLARLDGERPVGSTTSTSPCSAATPPRTPGRSPPTGTSALIGLGRAARPRARARRRAAAAPGGHQPRLQRAATTPRPAPPSRSPSATGPTAAPRCEVRDHGHGVDPAQARRVFERFYRADPARSRRSNGSAAATGWAWPSSRPSSARTTARSASPRPPEAARRSSSNSHSKLTVMRQRVLTTRRLIRGKSPRGAREP